MKELRKRVNGLIAILLAVCMVFEMSGIRVSAATTIGFGNNDGEIKLSDIPSIAPESLQLSEVGDIMQRSSSGGCFAIDATSDSGIVNYLNLNAYDQPASDGKTTFYTSASLKADLPVEYKAIQIVSASVLYNSDGSTPIRDTFGDSYLLYSIKLQWVKADTYTLNYDLNAGNGTAISSRKQQMEKNYSLENPSDLTRAGYKFVGWSFSKDGSGTTYTAGGNIVLPNDEITNVNDGDSLTLYAVWEPYTYYAEFIPGIGSVDQATPSGDLMNKLERVTGQVITLPECTYTLPNYHFAGWKYLEPEESIPDTPGENVGTVYSAGSTFEYLPGRSEESIQFEAQWEPNTVTINYDANGGTGSIQGTVSKYGSTTGISLPDANGSLSKDGYYFKGWCGSADGSSQIMNAGYNYTLDFSKDNQVITLYAIWEPNAYSIRFNGNGGTGEMANQSGISSEPTILNSNQFTSIDQMFAGWSTTGTGTVQYADRASFDYKASTNNQVVDLFAIWTKMYKLAFDANGGIGTMATSSSGIGGIAQTLPECAFTRDGFVFKGWSTNPNALTAEYQPADAFTHSPQIAGETVTLYAIWEEKASDVERIQVSAGTVYLTAGQEYFFGGDGVYKVDGDPTAYPMNTIFYVPESGYYTISVQ